MAEKAPKHSIPFRGKQCLTENAINILTHNIPK